MSVTREIHHCLLVSNLQYPDETSDSQHGVYYAVPKGSAFEASAIGVPIILTSALGSDGWVMGTGREEGTTLTFLRLFGLLA